MKAIKSITFLICLAALVGCASVHTAISKRNLDVQTKMSSTIFLDPVTNSQKVVYVQVHNTSGIKNMNISSMLKSHLRAKGYRITSDPSRAHYWLQANILRIANTDRRTADDAVSSGYGGTISGAMFGAGIGSLARNGVRGAIVGGLIGGVVGTVADALVKDEVYTVITDLQISEREQSQAVLQQGKRYRTRVVSTAEQVNLKFAKAKPALKAELSRALANIF